jgi:hypothetical protein
LVSGTAGSAPETTARLGLSAGQVVQELGWDEDADDGLRASVEDVTGTELVDEGHDEVVDVVLLWWRDGDGDLVDGLMDSLTDLDDDGVVWLLTPKIGSPGHVDPGDVADAAPTAGLTTSSSVTVSQDWSATKLLPARARAAGKR